MRFGILSYARHCQGVELNILSTYKMPSLQFSDVFAVMNDKFQDARDGSYDANSILEERRQYNEETNLTLRTDPPCSTPEKTGDSSDPHRSSALVRDQTLSVSGRGNSTLDSEDFLTGETPVHSSFNATLLPFL